MKNFSFLCATTAITFAGVLVSTAPLHAGTPVVWQDSTAANGAEASDSAKEDDLPLEAARTVSVDLTEGSWLSLDVSPDGATIVFDFLGDLYLMPLAGGDATELTRGLAFDGQPRFSPDGESVVYTSDRDGGENIWYIDLESREAAQVTKGKSNRYQSPEWTPDGDYIIASRTSLRVGSSKLYMFHKEGGSGVQLGQVPNGLKMLGAAFGPDPRYVWFAQRQGNWQYNAIYPQYQLAMYDRETGQRYTRSSRFGSGIRPTLSPDGQWLVYGSRFEAETGLRIRDLTTGDERWLAYPVQRDDQESRATRDALPGMSFTPDSRELVASFEGKMWRIPVEGGDRIEIPFHVQADVALGPLLDFDYDIDDAPMFSARQVRDATPSPDGSTLAFTVLDRLYVMEYPDGEPRRITDMEHTEAQPTWSPDGRWIAYVTWSADDGGHIYRVRADGGRSPERLTSEPAVYQQPAWSASDRIVAIRGPMQAYEESVGPFAFDATRDLVWVPSDGGDPTLIAPTDNRRSPHFTEDRDRIFLYHGQRGLISIRWDGTDEKAHVRVRGSTPAGFPQPMNASVIKMAPTGNQALAQVQSDIYVVTVPYVGGETPTISVANPDNAAFPATKLTEIGGQFPIWSADARKIHWSIGNAHVVYDLDRAKAVADSLEAAEEAEEEEDDEAADEEDTPADSAEVSDAADEEGGEEEEDDPGYKPEEVRIAISIARDVPSGVVVLRGARAITMRDDEIIENADIVVRDNRIEAVGARGSVTVPDGADVVDLSGTTIIPGFVDTHAHLRPAWGLHKQEAWAYLANLAYGVTSTRDPQTGTTDVLTYADMVESGEMLGPRIYSTGPGVFFQEGIRNQEHARQVLKRYSDYYDTKTIKMYVAGNREQRQWIIIAAREQELMPTTEGSLNMKMNLTQIIDGYPGHEHSFPIYPLYRDVVQLTAESQMVYTPTLLVAYGGPWAENYFYTRENPHDNDKLRRFTPHADIDRKTRRRGAGAGPGPGGWFLDDEHVFPGLARVVKDVVEAGGRAGVGSHGQLQGLGYHWELWAMQSGGMTEHDALRVATLYGADAIGFGQELGSIESGKLADLVILNANPLDDIRNTTAIRQVMKNGRLYDGDSLDEVWPRQMPLSRFRTFDDRPAVSAGIGH